MFGYIRAFANVSYVNFSKMGGLRKISYVTTMDFWINYVVREFMGAF